MPFGGDSGHDMPDTVVKPPAPRYHVLAALAFVAASVAIAGYWFASGPIRSEAGEFLATMRQPGRSPVSQAEAPTSPTRAGSADRAPAAAFAPRVEPAADPGDTVPVVTERAPVPAMPPAPRTSDGPMSDLVAIAPELPDGEAGLTEALRDGRLRLATDNELREWIARSSGGASMERLRFARPAYVVSRDMTLPGGLYGAHSAVFLLPRGVPFPRGNPGHSAIPDMASGACTGAICGILRE